MLAQTEQDSENHPGGDRICGYRGPRAGGESGEGLGNKFLSHIREVDAIVQVVRCFDDDDIQHVAKSVDPLRDIGINTELVLADLFSVRSAWQR